MSNSLDPDQAQHLVRPDLGPNCLQRLSADDTNTVAISRYSLLFQWQSHPNAFQQGIVGNKLKTKIHNASA